MASNHGGPRDRTARRRPTTQQGVDLSQLSTSRWLQTNSKLTELINNSPLVVIVYITVQAGWAPMQVCSLVGLLVIASAFRAFQPTVGGVG